MIDTDKLSDDLLLAHWEGAKKDFAQAKDDEMVLRMAVGKRFFPTPKEGTQHRILPDGRDLKLVFKLSYNLGKYEDVKQAQLRMIAAGNEGPFLADRLIKFSADCSVSEYRKLDDEVKKGNGTAIEVMNALNTVLTIKPGAPTLEIGEP